VSCCQPFVASTQTASAATCGAAVASTGTSPGVDTATTTISAAFSTLGQPFGPTSVMSDEGTMPRAGMRLALVPGRRHRVVVLGGEHGRVVAAPGQMRSQRHSHGTRAHDRDHDGTSRASLRLL
jgi:hypothetical protein